METITEIYSKIYENESSKDPKKFIATIEQDVESLLKYDFDNYDDRFKATRLISDYSLNIANEGFVRKSLPFLNHAILLFESDERLKAKDLLDEPMFEALIWKRGTVYFDLKQFSLAKQDFKRLALKWPDNDRFKNWFNSSINYRLNQMQWGFTFLIAFCILAKYVIGFKTDLTTYGNLIGLIGLTGTYVYKLMARIK